MNVPQQTLCLIKDLTSKDDVIIFKYKQDNYCFLKDEIVRYCQGEYCELPFGKLLGNINKLLEENKTIQIWSLQKHLGELTAQEFIINPLHLQVLMRRQEALREANRTDDCSLLQNKSLVIHDNYVAKTDEYVENEVEVYRKLNYGPRNYIMPNIAMLYGISNCNGKKYLIMEKGATDYARYIRENKLTTDQYRDNLLQLLVAYQYMLDKGYAHADFKPNNVIVVKDGNIDHLVYNLNDRYYCIPNHGYTVKLIDFGITKPVRRILIIKDLIRFIEVSRSEAAIAQNNILESYLIELLKKVVEYRTSDTTDLIKDLIMYLLEQDDYTCTG